jgi:hypothetical protein
LYSGAVVFDIEWSKTPEVGNGQEHSIYAKEDGSASAAGTYFVQQSASGDGNQRRTKAFYISGIASFLLE